MLYRNSKLGKVRETKKLFMRGRKKMGLDGERENYFIQTDLSTKAVLSKTISTELVQLA